MAVILANGDQKRNLRDWLIAVILDNVTDWGGLGNQYLSFWEVRAMAATSHPLLRCFLEKAPFLYSNHLTVIALGRTPTRVGADPVLLGSSWLLFPHSSAAIGGMRGQYFRVKPLNLKGVKEVSARAH